MQSPRRTGLRSAQQNEQQPDAHSTSMVYHPQPTRSGRVPIAPTEEEINALIAMDNYFEFPSESDSDDDDFVPPETVGPDDEETPKDGINGIGEFLPEDLDLDGFTTDAYLEDEWLKSNWHTIRADLAQANEAEKASLAALNPSSTADRPEGDAEEDDTGSEADGEQEKTSSSPSTAAPPTANAVPAVFASHQAQPTLPHTAAMTTWSFPTAASNLLPQSEDSAFSYSVPHAGDLPLPLASSALLPSQFVAQVTTQPRPSTATSSHASTSAHVYASPRGKRKRAPIGAPLGTDSNHGSAPLLESFAIPRTSTSAVATTSADQSIHYHVEDPHSWSISSSTGVNGSAPYQPRLPPTSVTASIHQGNHSDDSGTMHVSRRGKPRTSLEPIATPLSPDSAEAERKRRKNVEQSRIHRERKKARMEANEDRVRQLERENTELRVQVRELEKRLEARARSLDDSSPEPISHRSKGSRKADPPLGDTPLGLNLDDMARAMATAIKSVLQPPSQSAAGAPSAPAHHIHQTIPQPQLQYHHPLSQPPALPGPPSASADPTGGNSLEAMAAMLAMMSRQAAGGN